MDDLVKQFRSVTNATHETAIHFLEACGGNFETAIKLFLQQGEIGGGNGGEASSSGASANAGLKGDDLIRAPNASKLAVLVKKPVHKSVLRYPKARRANTVEKFRDFEAETKEKEESLCGASSSKEASVDNKKKSLDNLFRPPLEIMYRGTFEMAKAESALKGYWLMVNVQKTEKYACQALNRDVWRNAAVQDLIRNNFVLCQIFIDSADGQWFQTCYRVSTFPFVCILDPRTDKMLQQLKTHDSHVFCEAVSNFLEQNPSFKTHDSNYAAEAPDVSSATATVPKNDYSQSGARRMSADSCTKITKGSLQAQPTSEAQRRRQISLPFPSPVRAAQVTRASSEIGKFNFSLSPSSTDFVETAPTPTARLLVSVPMNEYNELKKFQELFYEERKKTKALERRLDLEKAKRLELEDRVANLERAYRAQEKKTRSLEESLSTIAGLAVKIGHVAQASSNHANENPAAVNPDVDKEGYAIVR